MTQPADCSQKRAATRRPAVIAARADSPLDKPAHRYNTSNAQRWQRWISRRWSWPWPRRSRRSRPRFRRHGNSAQFQNQKLPPAPLPGPRGPASRHHHHRGRRRRRWSRTRSPHGVFGVLRCHVAASSGHSTVRTRRHLRELSFASPIFERRPVSQVKRCESSKVGRLF